MGNGFDAQRLGRPRGIVGINAWGSRSDAASRFRRRHAREPISIRVAMDARKYAHRGSSFRSRNDTRAARNESSAEMRSREIRRKRPPRAGVSLCERLVLNIQFLSRRAKRSGPRPKRRGFVKQVADARCLVSSSEQYHAQSESFRIRLSRWFQLQQAASRLRPTPRDVSLSPFQLS